MIDANRRVEERCAMGKPSECLRGYGSKGAYPGRRPPRRSPARQRAAGWSGAHTLTDKKMHLFDTANIPANGGTGTFTAPTKPGSYPFGCTYPEMAGTLIVQG